MSFFVPTGVAGRRILSFAWQATAVFSLTAILTAIWPTTLLRVVAVTIALALFGLGMLLFLVAYLRSIARSRFEVISVAGIYLMMGGVAPLPVRRSLYSALAVQIVVALATASVRPYTSLAFGVLVPLFGLALCGLWSSVGGTFPPKTGGPAEVVAAETAPAPVDLEDEEPG
ncbi:MAG: hypothetical protein ABI658_01885 [Acidimicrobiales bacterium]